MIRRPHPWERTYPAGVRWDAPIETGTIPALLDRAAGSFADCVVLSFRQVRITYRELRAWADGLAAGLIAQGIGCGATVGLYLPNVPYHPVAFFAVARTGAKIVHLSPLDAERELAHKLQDSAARTVITTNLPPLLPMARRLRAAGLVDHLLVGEDERWGMGDLTPTATEDGEDSLSAMMEKRSAGPWPAIDENDVVLLQYTGGTTGAPKAAMLTHANLTAAVSSYEAWFRGQGLSVPGEDRAICVLPLFHIFGVTAVMLRHIHNGNEMILHQRFDAEAVLRDFEEKQATTMAGVPTMWIALTTRPDIDKRDLSSIRFCSSGGAPLAPEISERFRRLTGAPLCNGWGLTETAPAATNYSHHGAVKPGSVGQPLPGITVEIVALDDPHRVLAPGEIGELRVKGPNVMQGYWNRPEDNAAAFADGGFLTGDIGTMDEDGYFFIVDRKKDMIISGGFNVYPTMIEHAIYEHADVEEVIVIGVPDAYRGEAAKAFVKLRAGAPALTLEALQAFLSDKIGRHEMPAALEIRDALPRTTVGKLSKLALMEEERRRGPALHA